MPVITFKHETSGGVEHEHELPARFEVCDGCQGEGRRLHEAIASHAYTADEFAREFDDDDRDEYFKGGAGIYGVECWDCRGQRVIPVVDEEAASHTLRGRRLLALYQAVEGRIAEFARQEAHERRMGY